MGDSECKGPEAGASGVSHGSILSARQSDEARDGRGPGHAGPSRP